MVAIDRMGRGGKSPKYHQGWPLQRDGCVSDGVLRCLLKNGGAFWNKSVSMYGTKRLTEQARTAQVARLILHQKPRVLQEIPI